MIRLLLYNRKILIQYSVLFVALLQSPVAEAVMQMRPGIGVILSAGIIGLAADIFYSAEFIVRIIKSGKGKGFRFYFLHGRGWADFLNSVVMLLFVSVPYMIIALTLNPAFYGNGLFFTIYSFSASLRILRLFKLASFLAPSERGMSSRHTWLISVIVISVICVSSSVIALCGLRSTGTGLTLYFVSLMIVIVSGFYYRRYFEENVSKVIRVIDSGMRKKNYNHMAVINDMYKDDEVYHLADYYNRIFLPVKMKKILKKDKRL